MSLTAKNEGGDFKPAPAGNHIAICYAVIDLGTQHTEAFVWEGKPIAAGDKPQILIMWELPQELVTYEKDGTEHTRPAGISKFYNAYLSDRAALRQHLEAWRGRQFTAQELQGFHVGNILGKPCMLNIVHTEAGKAKVSGVAAMPKGVSVPQQTNESILFDLDSFDQTVFDRIPEGIQNIIKRSAEWQQNTFAPEQPEGFRENPAPEDFDSDSIPF